MKDLNLQSQFLPRLKPGGPSEPLVYGDLKPGQVNSYYRKTFLDEEGQRIHSFSRNYYMEKSPENLELQKFVGGLLVNFHLSKIVQKTVGENVVVGSVEHNARIDTIDADQFKRLFPDRYAEATSEVLVMRNVLVDGNKSLLTGRVRGEGENLKLYEDGSYTIFDFESVVNFFMYYKSEHLESSQLQKLPTDILLFLKDKLSFLKNFYSSAEGVGHFSSLVTNCSVDFYLMFVLRGMLEDDIEDMKLEATSQNFLTTFLDRVTKYLSAVETRLSELR